MTQTKIVNVAAGVLMRPDGHVLLAQRPAGKPYEGWWEFPGGKFEPGENAEVAVTRELEEELGIRVLASSPWVVREHVYEHAHVRLFFRRITAWEGEPRGREGQQLAWCALDTVNLDPLLPASVDLIRWLQLSPVYAISDAAGQGIDTWLARLSSWLEEGDAIPVSAAASSRPAPVVPGVGASAGTVSVAAVGRDVSVDAEAERDVPALAGADAGESAVIRWASRSLPRLLLLREPDLPADAFSHLLTETLARLEGHDVRVLVSSRHPEQAARLAAERTRGGLHLTGADLRALSRSGGDVQNEMQASACGWAGQKNLQILRSEYPLIAASCHSVEDLQRAGLLQLDLAVYGPVLPTRSHPGSAGLGWAAFAQMLAAAPIPVYALGGMLPAHLPNALQAGAQGVAMQRGVW